MALYIAIREYTLPVLLTMNTLTLLTKIGLNDDEVMALKVIKDTCVVYDKDKKPFVNDIKDVIALCNMQTEAVEIMVAIFLDHDNTVICTRRIAEGSRDAVAVCKQRILELVVAIKACNVYLVHNHPRGGDVSQQDIKFTREIGEALQMHKCNLLDHLVYYPKQAEARSIVTLKTIQING